MSDMIKTKTTFAEYASLPESNQIIELIDGEVILNPPLDAHQDVLGNIYLFLRQRVQGGVLRMAPTGVYFDDANSFEPDIFWVSTDNDHCFLGADHRFWHGAPDLIVEVLSVSTTSKDRGIKFDVYEQSGVAEYWLVDPLAQYVEVYKLHNGTFNRIGLFEADQAFASHVLGGAQVEVSQFFSAAP